MNKNRVRFSLCGLTDPRTNKVIGGVLDDSFEAPEKNCTKMGSEYLRFLGLFEEAKTFNEVDVSFWWDKDLQLQPYHENWAPHTDVKLIADRIIRILRAEGCVRVYSYERNNVVMYYKTPAFGELLARIITVEEHLQTS